MKVKINVTNKHIDKGIIGDCNKCPVALAIMDAIDAKEVSVDGDITIYSKNKDMEVYEYKGSKSVGDFIDAFDVLEFESFYCVSVKQAKMISAFARNLVCKPFSFTLNNVPAEMVKAHKVRVAANRRKMARKG